MLDAGDAVVAGDVHGVVIARDVIAQDVHVVVTAGDGVGSFECLSCSRSPVMSQVSADAVLLMM